MIVIHSWRIYFLVLSIFIHQILAAVVPADSATGGIVAITLKSRAGTTQLHNRLLKRTKEHTEKEEAKPEVQSGDECSICLHSMTTGHQQKTSCGHEFHEKCLSSWLENHLTCPLCRKTIRETDSFDTLIEKLRQDWERSRQGMMTFTTSHDWIFTPEILDTLVPRSHQSSSTYEYFRNASANVYLVMHENDNAVNTFIQTLRAKQTQCRNERCSRFTYWIEKTKAQFRFKQLLADLQGRWHWMLEMAVHAQFTFATGRRMTAYEAHLRERMRKPQRVDRDTYALFLGRLRELRLSNEMENPEAWTYYLSRHNDQND